MRHCDVKRGRQRETMGSENLRSSLVDHDRVCSFDNGLSAGIFPVDHDWDRKRQSWAGALFFKRDRWGDCGAHFTLSCLETGVFSSWQNQPKHTGRSSTSIVNIQLIVINGPRVPKANCSCSDTGRNLPQYLSQFPFQRSCLEPRRGGRKSIHWVHHTSTVEMI